MEYSQRRRKKDNKKTQHDLLEPTIPDSFNEMTGFLVVESFFDKFQRPLEKWTIVRRIEILVLEEAVCIFIQCIPPLERVSAE